MEWTKYRETRKGEKKKRIGKKEKKKIGWNIRKE